MDKKNLKKISCCIDMMFSDLDFYDRISAVHQCGINTIEFWKWTNKDIDKVVDLLNKYNMNLSIFNIDSTNEKLSADLARGILNDGRDEDFVKALKESIPVYKKLNAKAMIVLIGDNAPYNKENVIKCLNAAKPICEENNVTLIVEPLNDIDRKNYSMPYANPVFEVLREVNSPNIKMLYDIYHQNMMKDFSMSDIEDNIDLIGHFHIADAPGRHEPGTGQVNYPKIIKQIKELDYSGYLGLEYRATKPDKDTLGFLNM